MDRFLEIKVCDRCGKELLSRKMSWFTEEVLCHNCCIKERELRERMRKNKIDDLIYEGCGYIPNY